jgi:hypothetical protein
MEIHKDNYFFTTPLYTFTPLFNPSNPDRNLNNLDYYARLNEINEAIKLI